MYENIKKLIERFEFLKIYVFLIYIWCEYLHWCICIFTYSNSGTFSNLYIYTLAHRTFTHSRIRIFSNSTSRILSHVQIFTFADLYICKFAHCTFTHSHIRTFTHSQISSFICTLAHSHIRTFTNSLNQLCEHLQFCTFPYEYTRTIPTFKNDQILYSHIKTFAK